MPLMIYCTAALTSFSDSISYITYLFSEWRIAYGSSQNSIFKSSTGQQNDPSTIIRSLKTKTKSKKLEAKDSMLPTS